MTWALEDFDDLIRFYFQSFIRVHFHYIALCPLIRERPKQSLARNHQRKMKSAVK
jgi:hypothetical protein